MKKLALSSSLIFLTACSGIAEEAVKDSSNKLVQPPFINNPPKVINQVLVEVYTTSSCPWCVKAKALLDSHHIIYVEYNLSDKPKLREDLKSRTIQKTVPQIFIDGKHIGGYTDLKKLEDTKKLIPMVTKN